MKSATWDLFRGGEPGRKSLEVDREDEVTGLCSVMEERDSTFLSHEDAVSWLSGLISPSSASLPRTRDSLPHFSFESFSGVRSSQYPSPGKLGGTLDGAGKESESRDPTCPEPALSVIELSSSVEPVSRPICPLPSPELRRRELSVRTQRGLPLLRAITCPAPPAAGRNESCGLEPTLPFIDSPLFSVYKGGLLFPSLQLPSDSSDLSLKPRVQEHLQNLPTDNLMESPPPSGLRELSGGHKPCSITGCPKRVRSRGLCKAHGGGRRCVIDGCQRSSQGGSLCISHGGGKRCKVEDCGKAAQSRGMCKGHGGGVRCKVEGCTKSSQGSGFCRAHGGGKKCKVENCVKGAQRGGFCAGHGGSRYCQIPGCSKNDRGGGFCTMHGGGKKCKGEGCVKPSRTKGFCIMHFNQYKLAMASNPSEQTGASSSTLKPGSSSTQTQAVTA